MARIATRDAFKAIFARAAGLDRKVPDGRSFSEGPDGITAHLALTFTGLRSQRLAERCLTILGHCRKAMKPNGRLLIVEMVLPPGDAPHPGKILDMVMLVLMGGQERTEAEYAHLLDKAGFRLNRVVATQSPVTVVEAILA